LARETGAHRKTAADPLRRGEDVRLNAIMLVGIELTCSSHAALNLVEHQHQVMLVAGRAQSRQELVRRRPNAALALDRLQQEARRILVDGCKSRVEVVELDNPEAWKKRRETVDHLCLVRRADRAHGPTVEGVGKGDEVVFVRISLSVMVSARGLDRALHRLNARVGEENCVSKRIVAKPPGERLPLWRAVEV